MCEDLQKLEQKRYQYLTGSEILQYLNTETDEAKQESYFLNCEQEDPDIDNSDEGPDYIQTNFSFD